MDYAAKNIDGGRVHNNSGGDTVRVFGQSKLEYHGSGGKYCYLGKE